MTSQTYPADILDIDELIELSYVVFQNYRPHRPLEVCTFCCMCSKNVALIYQLPVRELSREVIYDYLDSAQCDERALSDEIRYFAPRIFELLAKGQNIRHSTEYTLDKFHLNLGVWTQLEMAVFKQFAKLFLKKQWTRFDDDKFRWIEIFEYIEMFYLAGLDTDIDELLGVLLNSLDNDITLIMLCHGLYYHFKKNYYDSPEPKLNHLLYEWLHNEHHAQIISHKILALTQKPIYQTLDEEQCYWLDRAFDLINEN